MKQKILKQLCMALCLFANTSAMAQFGDWKIVYRDECEKIGDFYYKLSTNGTAEVACPGLYYNVKTFRYSWGGDYFFGSKAIPETVSYEGKTYTVTGIGEKAFAGMGTGGGVEVLRTTSIFNNSQ